VVVVVVVVAGSPRSALGIPFRNQACFIGI
jgi:hypothetical protein